MITVIVAAHNSEHTLGAALTALVPAAIDGIVRQVLVVDGGSTDQTAKIADLAGADFISNAPGRGRQFAQGAARARFPWLLFLSADTVLAEGWERSATAFMRSVDLGERSPAAAAFAFRIDDNGFKPRLLERLFQMRCKLSPMPYGDQGLLISRQLFDAVGGYQDLPVLEDVDLARRLGRRRLAMLDAQAIASSELYRRDGYLLRSLRNQICHALFGLGLPINVIARLYRAGAAS
jgi:glycosyltransferase involved in cell wall biosynthesis